MKNKFLLLVAALVLSTATFATTPSTLSSTETGVTTQVTKDDMCEMVRQYMESQNISVMFVGPEAGTQNYLVKDTFGMWYRVYVIAGIIEHYEEIDF